MVKKDTQKTTSISDKALGIPVVAVLGHVDHGKTSLLDAIRKTNIAGGEHGGITQKIGASTVEVVHEGKKRKITFIDTPGHEAFSKMRSRGATACDIGLLIISSTDGMMPQTKESIQHLLLSKVPFIVVLTKSDLPEKNIEKVKQQLEKEQILLEGRGGDTPVIEVSAKTGANIKELLELIVLVFDLKSAEVKKEQIFKAIIIESKKDSKKGVAASAIIRSGNLTIKDEVVCGKTIGRIRALLNAEGKQVKEAGEGEAVEIMGFEDVPQVGDIVYKKSEASLEIPQQQLAKPIDKALATPTISPNFFLSEDDGRITLSIVLCADTEGSLEAILASLPKDVKILLKKTGEISEADILLAKSTGAFVIGFNTKIRNEITHLARVEKVLVKNYTIIYELLDEVKDALEGKVIAEEEHIYGTATILASFPFEKSVVLGIRVLEGRVARGDKIRIMRGEEIVGESIISSLRQGKEQISKVEKGKEAGIILSPALDFTIGDMLLCHS